MPLKTSVHGFVRKSLAGWWLRCLKPPAFLAKKRFVLLSSVRHTPSWKSNSLLQHESGEMASLANSIPTLPVQQPAHRKLRGCSQHPQSLLGGVLH